MFAFAVCTLAALLAVRSFCLGLFEKKNTAKRASDFLICALFSTASFLLYCSGRKFIETVGFEKTSFAMLFLLTAAIGTPLLIRLSRKGRSRFYAWAKTIFLFLFAISAMILFTFASFHRFSQDKPILRVVMTGQTQFDLAANKRHEVILEWADGSKKERFFLLGDLVAVRAKVIRLSPWLNFLGCDNLFQIDAVYGSYRSMEDLNTKPINGFRIASSSPTRFFPRWVWAKWENLFLQEQNCAWIKSATLESNYFPLVSRKGKPFCGSYLLSVNTGGLSALPADWQDSSLHDQITPKIGF